MAGTSTTYVRTVSSDDGRGFRYETKMTALTALRLFKYSNEFYLANNFAKAGKFDDIVFTASIDGKWKTYFIQLKQKQASTLESKKIYISALRGKGDFVIRKYYESYNSILQKFKKGSDVVFSKDFSDATFILYTNAYLNELLLTETRQKFNFQLLDTNHTNGENIKFNYFADSDIFQGIAPTQKLHNFLDNFYLCTKQACEEDMDALIQNEIKELAKVTSDVEAKYFTNQLCNFIYTWCKTGEYLTKNHVQSILLKTSIESQTGKKDDSSFEFIPSFLKHCFESVKRNKLVLYISKTDSCVMCMQMLKQSGLFNDPNKLFTLKQIEKEDVQEHVISEWTKNNVKRTLVLDCEGDNLNINHGSICKFLKNVSSQNILTRILLIATKKNITASEIAQSVGAKNATFNCSLVHLTELSKSMLVNSEVLFQGYKTKLSTVMANSKRSLDDVFNVVSMTDILQGRLISVGVKPVDHIPYYVTRVLTRQSTVSSDVFVDPEINACYALTGLSLEKAIDIFSCSNVVSSSEVLESKLSNPPKVIVLEEDPAFQFDKISNIISKPIHWFEKSKKWGNMWHWHKSSRDIIVISKYLENMLDYVATDNIMNINHKLVVVTAEPGMGKSTLLNHLAAETKRMCPHVWVISIVLNDSTEFFNRKDFVENAEVNTKELLASAAGVNNTTSKFDSRLFEECYNSGNMIVLLDGFDEIVPYFTKQGLALIETLHKSPISRVWVSARPVLRDLLETQTCTLSYTIKPFELKDQKNFLAKYWKSEMPGLSTEKLATFINQVVDLIDKSFDEKLHQFTGIPLQTKMLAEVFHQDLKIYHDTETLNLKRLNGVQLFENFVNIKRGIQLQKAKITVTNAMVMYDQKRLDEARELNLMFLALLTILPSKTCQSLEPGVSKKRATELKKHVNDGHEKTGIVMSFKGDIPQFIHRTFAEYYTALYFTKHFSTNRAFLSSNDFFTETFEFVKYFFDRILATGHELHEAVLARDDTEVMALLKRRVNVDSLDNGGRTALHVAAALPRSQSIILLLVAAGAQVELTDDVLGWKSMTYATKLGGIENIAPILEKTQEKLDENVIPITWETLLMAVQGDYLQTLLHLIENGIYSVENLDELSSQKWINHSITNGLTILHLAAAYDSVKILNYFLQKRSRDSKIRLIELKEANGLTPLLLAASMGKVDAVNCLLRAGASSLASSPAGETLLQYAAASRSLELFRSAVIEAERSKVSPDSFLPMVVTTLISDKSEWGSHALQLLLSLYPNVNMFNTNKNVPFITFAAMKGNELAVRRLCELGANVNVLGEHGSPLHFAVAGGHEEIVRILLACPHIKVDTLDSKSLTPFFKAVLKGSSTDICEQLIAAGADVNIISVLGTPLHSAVINGNDDIVRVLLSSPNIKIDQVDDNGYSVLYEAVLRGHTSIYEMLIKAGANLNLIAKNGNDLTHAVASTPTICEPILNDLVARNLNFCRKNSFGETAMDKLKASGVSDNILDSLFKSTKSPLQPMNPVAEQEEIVKKKRIRKKKSVTQQDASGVPVENIVKSKQPDQPKPPKAKKKPNAPVTPAQKIYDSKAFLDILKELKGSDSPQVDEVAEKLKSFINLAITSSKNSQKPPPQQQKKPKVKKVQPVAKKTNISVPPVLPAGLIPNHNPSPKKPKNPPPCQNPQKVSAGKAQPKPIPSQKVKNKPENDLKPKE